MKLRLLTTFATLAFALGLYGVTHHVKAMEQANAQPAAAPAARQSDWPVYGGQSANDHYSPLTQINQSNVHALRVAWTYDTGDKGSGLQTSPLIVGHVLYACTPTQRVIALNAATGKRLWAFDSGLGGTQPTRGLTYWNGEGGPRIFAAAASFLYALDATTGKPISSFGEGGRIDLRKGLGRDYREQSIALTTPGIVYRDLIIVGGREPETYPAPPGDIRAFDVHTGALRWTFHTIPHPGEYGYETWPKGAWKYAGAANNWTGMTLDAQRGIVYVPTGSAVFDFYGGDRAGNDLFADTLLALDAETGKRIWHFQGVHHDIWDRDFPSPPSLVTVVRNGKRVDAVAQTTKQGFLYLFDRVTGQPLFPIVEEPAPPSSVPGEVTSPTQPRPLAPAPFVRQTLTESMLTDRTPSAHAFALKEFKTFLGGNEQFVPFTLDRQTIVFPGFDGGAEWGGSAVDPATGVIYINANTTPWTGGIDKSKGGSPGQVTYGQFCAVCHGENRQGSPPEFPSLIGIDKRLSDATIENTIHRGKGRMPAFPVLDDATMQSLLQYLKGAEAPSGDKQEMTAASPAANSNSGAEKDKAGAASYANHCAVCHGDHREGNPPSFPSLLGVGSRMTSSQVQDLIHHGKGMMPAFSNLQGGELEALLRYLGVTPGESSSDTAAQETTKYLFTGYRAFVDSDGYPAIQPPWGTLNAIDLNTGKYLWTIPLGEYPALAAKGMKNTGTQNYGGPIVTGSGVLFIGATIYDNKMRAFESHTGKLLWEATLPSAGAATPATYMVGGKQYVVIATGGSKFGPPTEGKYVAFALP